MPDESPGKESLKRFDQGTGVDSMMKQHLGMMNESVASIGKKIPTQLISSPHYWKQASNNLVTITPEMPFKLGTIGEIGPRKGMMSL